MKPANPVAALTGLSVTAADASMMSDSVQITVAAVDKDGKGAPGDHQIHVEFLEGALDLCDLWIEFEGESPFTTSPSLPADKNNCVRPQGGAPVKAKLTESASKVSATIDVGPDVAERLAKIAAFDTPPEGGRMQPKAWEPMAPDVLAKAVDADLADAAKIVALIDAAPLAKMPTKICDPKEIIGHDPPTIDYETLRVLAGKPPTLPAEDVFAWINRGATQAWIDRHDGTDPPKGGYGEETERQLVTGRKLLIVYHASARRAPAITAKADAKFNTKGRFVGGYFVGSIDLVDRSRNKLLCRHTLAVANAHEILNEGKYGDDTSVREDLRMNLQLAAFDAVNQRSGRDVLKKDSMLEHWRADHPVLPKPER